MADLRRIIDASGAHAQVEQVITDLVERSLARSTRPPSPPRPARCCASSPPRPPTAWSSRRWVTAGLQPVSISPFLLSLSGPISPESAPPYPGRPARSHKTATEDGPQRVAKTRQSRLGTLGTSGPSPRSTTTKGPPRSALTRPPSTESDTEKARSVLRGAGSTPSAAPWWGGAAGRGPEAGASVPSLDWSLAARGGAGGA